MAINGIQTSFDIQEYVSQIMEYERQPLNDLEERKSTMEEQISSWDRINSSLKQLQSTLDVLQKASTFQSTLTTSSDSSYLTATAAVNAAETTYTFSNITLATPASAISSSAIGLLSGTAATVSSGEEIITGGSTVNPNTKIASLTLDPGKSIVAGSFYVNGKEIEVTSDDTIYTILSKINSSGANIEAIYSDDTISISNKTNGVSYSVRLGDDTTGFFDAMKLTLDSSYPNAYGVDHDYHRDIAETALSGSITNGYININNMTFSIDVDTESIADIVNKINASEAGVLAYYDDVDDKITLTSVVNGQDITLSNDTAGFFSALNIVVQTYTGTGSQFDINGQTMTRDSNTFEINGATFTLRSPTSAGETVTLSVERDKEKIQTAIEEFVNQYNTTNSLMKEETATDKALENDNRVKSIMRRLRTMVSSTVPNDDDENLNLNHLSEVGISLKHNSLNKNLELDMDKLADALDDNISDVFSLFATNTHNYITEDDGGFSVLLDTYIENFTGRFSGFIVDRKEAIESSIERLETKIERVQDQMDRKEQTYIEEFQELQNAMSRLESISNSAALFLGQFGI